jgi:hypothetical protein
VFFKIKRDLESHFGAYCQKTKAHMQSPILDSFNEPQGKRSKRSRCQVPTAADSSESIYGICGDLRVLTDQKSTMLAWLEKAHE